MKKYLILSVVIMMTSHAFAQEKAEEATSKVADVKIPTEEQKSKPKKWVMPEDAPKGIHSKWFPRAEPNPHPDAQWFHQAAFGLFMHWGIVSAEPQKTGSAWKMQKGMSRSGDIPPSEMFKTAETWNPTKYDPDKWMKAAHKAGFRYAVLTARHHDAYALWPSQHGEWHAGHYMNGRDLIKPYVEACRKNDIKVGFYFSRPDWYHSRKYENFGFKNKYRNDPKAPKYNWKHEEVESLPEMPEDLRQKIAEMTEGQTVELLTNYGKIDLLWPDGGTPISLETARKLQPGIIYGRHMEYATPEGWGHMKMEHIKYANAKRFPWELCDIGHGGSWHWSEKAEKHGGTAGRYLYRLAKVRARGGNYLLNIAPRPDGEMPKWFYPVCEQMGQWMEKGAEAIYDVQQFGDFPYPDQIKEPTTVKKTEDSTTWYVFTEYRKSKKPKEITAKNTLRPSSVVLLHSGKSLNYRYDEKQKSLTVDLKGVNLAKGLPDVVKVTFENTKKTQ